MQLHWLPSLVVQKEEGAADPMTTLNDFKALRASVPAQQQQELFKLMTSSPDAALQRMVQIAAEKGVTLTTEEVRGFLREMDDSDEFDDIALDAVALTAIAGGGSGHGKGKC